ncbi:MAG TPA: hypothetical protein VMG38_07055 [Trebonia sp.]|nr:hypothetical protein [Trebonia sp.]
MISEPVLVEVGDRIATVTLNRPAARNALNRATQYALWDAIAAADRDPSGGRGDLDRDRSGVLCGHRP